MSFSHVLDYVTTTAWALEPGVYHRLMEVATRHGAGIKLSAEEIAQAIGRDPKQDNPRNATYQVSQGIAVIPVQGVIAKYSSQVNGSSQPRGTSNDAIQQNLAAALDDPAVVGILLLVDSPGGSVDGVAATSAMIAEAADRKPMVAYIPDLGASAAYWMASQCPTIMAGPTARVGSIGVYSSIVDSSVQAHNDGVHVNLLSSGPNKGVGADGTRVSDAQVAEARKVILDLHSIFVNTVAKGRETSADAVAPFADGRVFIGQNAVDANLVDSIGSMADAMALVRTMTAGQDPGGGNPDPNSIPSSPDYAGSHPSALQAQELTMAITPARLAELCKAHHSLAADLAQMHASDEKAVNDFINTKTLGARDAQISALQGEVTTLKATHATELAAQTTKLTALETELASLKAKHGKMSMLSQTVDPGAEAAGPAATQLHGAELWKQEFASNEHIREAFYDQPGRAGVDAYVFYRKSGQPMPKKED
jgi:signal peptide peptidase SppA